MGFKNESKQAKEQIERSLARMIPELTKYFRTIEDCKECQKRLKLDLDITAGIVTINPPKTDCLRYAAKLAKEKTEEYNKKTEEAEKNQVTMEKVEKIDFGFDGDVGNNAS